VSQETDGGAGTLKETSTTNLDLGIGYHGVLGAEYQIMPGFSLSAGLDLEAMSLSKAKETGERLQSNPSGTVVSDEFYETDYVDSPPKLKSPVTTVSGTQTTTDDGVTVSTYDSATGQTKTKKTVGKTETVDFSRIAPFLRATFRF
jgi:hypothetical protein